MAEGDSDVGTHDADTTVQFEEDFEKELSSEEGCMVSPDDISVPLPSSYVPLAGAFQPIDQLILEPEAMKPAHKRQKDIALVAKLTVYIKETYSACNPTFAYSDSFNPKRILTRPSVGVSNDGFDNANSDLILGVNTVLINQEANSCRYIVKDMLGQGTFGQVAKCWKEDTEEYVAVKVIKNQPAYYHQAFVEISVLKMLNQQYDPDDGHHIVRLLDHFVHQKHLCLVFELLTYNLFELIKQNQFRGLSMNLVRLFCKQILDSLTVLREASVIHCDLKPENILLKSLQSGEIKLIDFGSACMENRTVYSYIQSRFYRSPEVLLGHQYTCAIDMWSLGCVAAELFLGLPLFPGASEYNLLYRMIKTLGAQPPDHLLRVAKQTHKFFKRTNVAGADDAYDGPSQYVLLSEEEVEARDGQKPAAGKRYFKHTTLDDIIIHYSIMRGTTEEERKKETLTRIAFVDFLRGLMEFDPVRRWTPQQAVLHPFISEEAFEGTFRPPPETPRTPLSQGIQVPHHPSKGHWSAAGLSPQVNNLVPGQYPMSPQYGSSMPGVQHYGVPNSYSSYGTSYGSNVGDGQGLGSSYGSYGEGSMGTAMAQQSNLGMSPERRFMHIPQVPGASPRTHLPMSPSGPYMRPMSLGMSPGQFTPPTVQYLPSSPSQYGLSPQTSPSGAKYASMDSYGAASLTRGKGGGGQSHPLNKRRARGSGSYELPQSGLQWQRLQSSEAGGSPLSGGAGPVRRHNRTSSLPSSSAYEEYGALGLRAQAAQPPAPQWASTGSGVSGVETASEGEDNMSPPPDPGDWDPFYAEQLLLEEETAPVGNPPTSGMGSGGARLGPGPPGLGISAEQNAGGGFEFDGARAETLFARSAHQGLGSSAPHPASNSNAWYQTGVQDPVYGGSAPYYGARHTQGFDVQQQKAFGHSFGAQHSPQQRRRGSYQDALSPTQRPRLDYSSKENHASWQGNPPRGGELWQGPEGGGADAALHQQQVLQQAFLAQQLSPQRKPGGGPWQQGNGYPSNDLGTFSLGPSNLSAAKGPFGSSAMYSQGPPSSGAGSRPGAGGSSGLTRASFGLGAAQLDSPGKPPPSPQRADSGMRSAYESPGRTGFEASKRSGFEGGNSRGGALYGSPSGHGGLEVRMSNLESPGRRRTSAETTNRGVYGSPGRPPDEGGRLGLGLRSAVGEQQSLGLEGGGAARVQTGFGGGWAGGLAVSTPEPFGGELGGNGQWAGQGFGESKSGLADMGAAAAFQQAMAGAQQGAKSNFFNLLPPSAPEKRVG